MLNLGIVYGGMSSESDISIKSAKSVIKNLNKEKYNIFKIFIDKDGIWYEEKNNELTKIENNFEFLKQIDVVFPVLHGLYGEDGTIQGMLELLKIKYVGCGILASSVGMDKAYSKLVFEKAGINQAKYIYLKKAEKNNYIYIQSDLENVVVNKHKIIDIVNDKLNFPVFIKPANSGSSVGVNRACDEKQLIENLEIAFRYDNKVLIEKAIKGKEVECAVLGKNAEDVIVTDPGEIIPAEEYYSFDAKYNNVESKTLIPANISTNQKETIKYLAKKAFLAIDGKGLSRVDFFVEDDTGKIYINEINTMPGFTEISMFPKLFQNYGYSYSELLDKIIGLA